MSLETTDKLSKFLKGVFKTRGTKHHQFNKKFPVRKYISFEMQTSFSSFYL